MAHSPPSSGGVYPQTGQIIKVTHGRKPSMGYLTSCSRSTNRSELKKSMIVMPRPSQSFLMVATVVLLLRPLTMLFTVDCVTPLLVHSALMEISRSWQRLIIRCRTASPIVIAIPSFSAICKERVHNPSCQSYLI